MADTQRLDQVLSNLLTNAYKYGEGEVRLQAMAHSGTVVICVSDNGPGVAEDFVRQLFEPFSRARDAAGSAEGAGLGLAIARRAAEAFGGQVWYERPPDGGSRFCVRLATA
jgi:signal transduction histidine kinase